MFGRKSVNVDPGPTDADRALEKSLTDYQAVQDLKPVVERVVRGHQKLQLENHFSERIWLAYRGDY